MKKFYYNKNDSILGALQLMDDIRIKLLLIYHDNKYVGLLSIGDIQRAILKNIDLNTPVERIIRNDYIIANPSMSLEEIKQLMLKIRAEFMPVISDNGDVMKTYFWNDLFLTNEEVPVNQFSLPVVIMAGGFGSRLKPLTNVLPKPLIPLNEKTFIEDIFERFYKHGCDTFHVSVNYKADLIEYYLNQQNLPYELNFFREDKPLGTAGSLSLLKGKLNKTFFVTNCDILVEQDYSEVLKYHNENNNEITLIASLKHFPISYGTIETSENGVLKELIEKPELTFKINSGMYILEPHLLNEIPENEFFHITNLIKNIQDRNGKVGVFPISEKSWIDIGNWEEYLNHIKS